MIGSVSMDAHYRGGNPARVPRSTVYSVQHLLGMPGHLGREFSRCLTSSVQASNFGKISPSPRNEQSTNAENGDLRIFASCRWRRISETKPRNLQAREQLLLRTRTTGSARQHSSLLARGNRLHVALHLQQRNHRGLPHQNGTSPTPSLWFQKLQQLPFAS